MKELQAILDAWIAIGGGPSVLATVVETSGSTYRRSGARMLLTRDRWVAGCVSGGCVESDLMQTAWERTANGPVLVTYDTSADTDIIWGLGLGCNGTVTVLLERLSPADEGLLLLGACLKARESCVIATVISEGANLGKRSVIGPLSASVDASIMAWPTDTLPREGYEIRESETGRILIECIQPSLKLVICGAGHDAMPLVRFAKELGWYVVVVDRREAFATRDRFPTADEVVAADPVDFPHKVPLDDRTWVVVMTHNYLNDRAILEQLSPSPVPYIGLLGPRARTERLLSELERDALIRRLHGPVGLNIGAQGPEEIALSIVAEIQALKTVKS